MFILEESPWPIHGTVTTGLDMNGVWEFQQILVYSRAGLLYSIDSFSYKRMVMELMQLYHEWSWHHKPKAEIFRFTQIKPLLDNSTNSEIIKKGLKIINKANQIEMLMKTIKRAISKRNFSITYKSHEFKTLDRQDNQSLFTMFRF